MIEYPKINASHKLGQESILDGEVVLEEKTDGSQFRISITSDGFEFGSKRVEFNQRGVDSNFRLGVNTFTENNKNFDDDNRIGADVKAVHFFGEYFKSEKQNTIKYDRMPKNHIMLFDVAIEYYNKPMHWCNNDQVDIWANDLEIEAVPVLGTGTFTMEQVKELAEQESVLGGSKREGVIIKARNRQYNTTLASLAEHPWMIAKYVRPEFQEDNRAEHPGNKGKLQELCEAYNNPNIWKKSVARLRDESQLEGSMKDLAKIIPDVMKDVESEWKETIMNDLWKIYGKDIIKHSVKGVPQWYQEQLITG